MLFILNLFGTAHSNASEINDTNRQSRIKILAKEFILVNPGFFTMGSSQGRNNEQPEHQVRISNAFELGKYEVTQALWFEITGKSPADQLEILRQAIGKPKHDDLRGVGDNNPAYLVSWNETQIFIRKLNAADEIYRYRLPTEAEWEFAAKAGIDTLYSFGNDSKNLEDYAWYIENSGYETHPVGLKKPNPWGFYDMHGNVHEWVQDQASDFSSGLQSDPRGPNADSDKKKLFNDGDKGPDRIMKGGSWGNPAHSSQSSRRTINNPNSRSRGLGFRLVRSKK